VKRWVTDLSRLARSPASFVDRGDELSQPPTPQWDAQQGRWVLPEQAQYAPPPGYAQAPTGHGPASGGPRHGGQNPAYGAPQAGYGQPTGQWPPPPPAPKKSRKWPWIVGGVVLLIVLISAINSGGSPAPTGATGAAPSAAPSSAPSAAGGGAESSAPAASGVVFEVTGSGRATSISYGTNGGVSQANGERLPWTESVEASDGFGVYSLTAQSNGSGEITCRITVDGEEIARQTSTGQYAVVSCSGSDTGF
jgi:hypothetical protein